MNAATQKYVRLVQREWWEHKTLMLSLPLVVVALLLIFMLGASFTLQHPEFGLQLERESSGITQRDLIVDFEAGFLRPPVAEDSARRNHTVRADRIFSDPLRYIHSLFMVLAWGLALLYLLGALFNDRKERSIFFWKSLPVSETQNVLVKLAVAALVIPLAMSLAAWAMQLLAAMALSLNLMALDVENNGVNLLAMVMGYLPAQLGLVFKVALYDLPLFAWVALASAYAKRTPFLVAVVPVATLGIAEHILFVSDHVFSTLRAYFAEGMRLSFEGVNYAGPPFWPTLLGLGLAVIFTLGAIWLRERRFEI